MQVIIAKDGTQMAGECTIEDRVVMVGRGDHWRPGVIVSGIDPMIDEIVGCAINEGAQLFNVYDEDEGMPPWHFWVSQASSAELSKLELLSSRPPKGAVIRTEDGYRFTVTDEGISDGDLTFLSLCELEVDFELTCNVPQSQLLPFEEVRHDTDRKKRGIHAKP